MGFGGGWKKKKKKENLIDECAHTSREVSQYFNDMEEEGNFFSRKKKSLTYYSFTVGMMGFFLFLFFVFFFCIFSASVLTRGGERG